ncbi:hypothetical protein Vafri_1310, partial [Volvox africanus]
MSAEIDAAGVAEHHLFSQRPSPLRAFRGAAVRAGPTRDAWLWDVLLFALRDGCVVAIVYGDLLPSIYRDLILGAIIVVRSVVPHGISDLPAISRVVYVGM